MALRTAVALYNRERANGCNLVIIIFVNDDDEARLIVATLNKHAHVSRCFL